MLSITQLDERIEKCLSILADNPHSQVFAALAEAYRKRGDVGRAFSVCRGGLKHHPDYAPAHVVMAKLYLHQGMHTDALAAIERAIALDGPTRATDCLEGEIYLAMGDVANAQRVLDRLRVSDPSNPALADLLRQLKRIKSGDTVTDRPVIAPTSLPVAPPKAQAPAPGAPGAPAVRTMTWADWADELASCQHVKMAFGLACETSADASARVLAVKGSYREQDGDHLICGAMFRELDAALRQAGDGALEELRVERPDGEIWCRRRGEEIIGFVARRGVAFGAARQSALDLADQVRHADEPPVATAHEQEVTRS